MTYTDFGTAMRKLRVQHMEGMRDTAQLLNCSIPFVSSVEKGKRPVPKEWLPLLVDHYRLSGREEWELRRAAAYSAPSTKFDLTNASPAQRELVFRLRACFNELRDEQVETLINAIEKCFEKDTEGNMNFFKRKNNNNREADVLSNAWIVGNPLSEDSYNVLAEQYKKCNGNIVTYIDGPWTEICGDPAIRITTMDFTGDISRIGFDPFASSECLSVNDIVNAIYDIYFAGYTDNNFVKSFICNVLASAVDFTQSQNDLEGRNFAAMFRMIIDGQKMTDNDSVPDYIQNSEYGHAISTAVPRKTIKTIYADIVNQIKDLAADCEKLKWNNSFDLNSFVTEKDGKQILSVKKEDTKLSSFFSELFLFRLQNTVKNNLSTAKSRHPVMVAAGNDVLTDRILSNVATIRPSELCWNIFSRSISDTETFEMANILFSSKLVL